MARLKAAIDATLAEKAEAALKDLPNCKACIRLKAIISSARYPISLVSSVFGTDRTTLWRWIKRFASEGVVGLADAPKGHKSPKLGAEPQQRVAGWLEEGRKSQGESIFWTLPKLMLAIEPLAKYPGIIREKLLGTTDMETPVNHAVNLWKIGCKISVFPEFWAWLFPATWNNILSPSAARHISLSNWSANSAMTPNMR
jgi:hypothetical protein